MLLSIMALLRGKVYSLFSPSPEKEQTPKSPGCLHQGCFVGFLDDLGAGWDVEGTALLREARRRRAPTATGRLRPGPRGSGGWCITPGQEVLDRLCLLLYCRELLGKALDGVAEQLSPPGRWGRRESVPCRRPSSLPGWARDGAPGPPWWTSPSRGTALWLSLLVEQSQSPCAVAASTPGRYYPCACVWAPWLGEPAG